MGRITRIVHTYYESNRKGTPHGSPSRSFRNTSSDEQPYVRELVAGEGWTSLDWGWIETPSLVTISNEENGDKKDPLHPMMEIWCGVGSPDHKEPLFLLFPREVFEGCPTGELRICVRSSFPVRFTLNVLPG